MNYASTALSIKSLKCLEWIISLYFALFKSTIFSLQLARPYRTVRSGGQSKDRVIYTILHVQTIK